MNVEASCQFDSPNRRQHDRLPDHLERKVAGAIKNQSLNIDSMNLFGPNDHHKPEVPASCFPNSTTFDASLSVVLPAFECYLVACWRCRQAHISRIHPIQGHHVLLVTFSRVLGIIL